MAKQELLDAVNHALDEILIEYMRDRHIIFKNEPCLWSVYYRELNKKIKSWNKRNKCIYRNCTNKSIKHSHSIQKSGPLKEIAKNSKVLIPEPNPKTGNVELIQKGLSRASIFPGFCKKHEALFKSFENSKNITGVEEILLQIYRSICREVVTLKHQIEFNKRLSANLEEYRDNQLKIILEEKLGTVWVKVNNCKIINMHFTEDPFINYCRKKNTELMNIVEELENQHLREIEECLKINNDNSEGTLNPVSISIDEQIPLALSGFGSFYVTEGNCSKRVLFILLVLPNDKGTDIIIHGKSSDTKYLHLYLSKLKNSFDILNMVEQWMIRHTNHWFLSSDVWNKKNRIEKAAILKEFMDNSEKLTDELNISIFDDIRRSMIDTWESKENTEEQLEILRREKAKLKFNI